MDATRGRLGPPLGGPQPAAAADPPRGDDPAGLHALWLRAELRACRHHAAHERHAGTAACAARARLGTWMPRIVVPPAPSSVGATHEARIAYVRRPLAAAVRGGLYPDDANRRDKALRIARTRSEAGCPSTRPGCVAPRSRRRLSPDDDQRIRCRPDA